jgi:hypothetical protein
MPPLARLAPVHVHWRRILGTEGSAATDFNHADGWAIRRTLSSQARFIRSVAAETRPFRGREEPRPRLLIKNERLLKRESPIGYNGSIGCIELRVRKAPA